MVTATEYYKAQGIRVRSARRYINLTQEQLAYELSLLLEEPFDGAKVSRIENGTQDVSSRELTGLATILEQSRDWLTGEDDAQFNDRVNPR